jgi:hypothetical protein
MANEAKPGAQGNTDNAGKGSEGTTDAAATKAAADKATADAATAAAAAAEAGKAGTDAAAAAAATAAAAAAAKKAPDKYELKAPEKSTIDESDIQTIETIARENNWTNDEAQAALDRHHETLVEQSTRFAEATKADKDYGGDKLAVSQSRAKAVIDKVRPASHPRAKAFRALLEKSGYGNHIEIVSFLADLGKMTEEDGGASGDASTGAGPRSAEEVLYGGKSAS